MPKAEPKMTAAPTPLHTVAGEMFVWRSPDPEVGEVCIPLKFKTKILRKAKELQDDDLEFMFFVLDSVLSDAATVVDEMDAGEMRAMFRAWQAAWEKRAEAAFPES